MINVHQYWVYIMSNAHKTVLYIGITNNLHRRYVEHRNGIKEGFTKKYRCHHLVYYEVFSQIGDAIAREKELKGWNRAKKESLIRDTNPILQDLAINLRWIDQTDSSSLRSSE